LRCAQLFPFTGGGLPFSVCWSSEATQICNQIVVVIHFCNLDVTFILDSDRALAPRIYVQHFRKSSIIRHKNLCRRYSWNGQKRYPELRRRCLRRNQQISGSGPKNRPSTNSTYSKAYQKTNQNYLAAPTSPGRVSADLRNVVHFPRF
jgi:hypothetical protein